MTDVDLFTTGHEPATTKAPMAGLLVTNHLNLLYMLAAGLVMPPTGFGNKYYMDTLEGFPGWIPLFVGSPSREAIEAVTKEAEYLKPAIVQFDLSRLSGPVMAMSADGFEPREFPHGFFGSELLILVPAPLPVSWIDFIAFRSGDDRKACEVAAEDSNNVPLQDYRRILTKKAWFTKAPSGRWPPTTGPEARSVPLQQPLAVGGVLAMLLRFGNLGQQAVHTCRIAFDTDDDAPGIVDDHPILSGLRPWITTGKASLPEPLDSGQDRSELKNASQARLFWEGVECLMEWREAGQHGNAENVLIDHLAVAAERLDPRLQAGVRRLHDTLESLTGLAGASASELFERHGTPLAHAMTLFLLRKDCADLYDYTSDRLVELDWLAASILFGIREGWMQLPLTLRSGRALSNAVSHRMAQLSHRLTGSGIELGEAPPRVLPLREMFGDGHTWRAREKSAARDLAKAQNWDCVHTRIDLRLGAYRFVVKGSSLSIEVPGEPRISPEVEQGRFLELLSGARLDSGTEAKIRESLGG